MHPRTGAFTLLYHAAFAIAVIGTSVYLGGGFLFPTLGWLLYVLAINYVWALLLMIGAFCHVFRQGLLKAASTFLFKRRKWEEMREKQTFGLDDKPERFIRRSSWPLIAVPLPVTAIVLMLFLSNDGYLPLLCLALIYAAFGIAGFLLARAGRLAPLPLGLGPGHDVF